MAGGAITFTNLLWSYIAMGVLSNDFLPLMIPMETIEVAKTEIAPISDARGTKEYKTFLLGQLIKAHFEEIRKASPSPSDGGEA